MEKLEKLEKLKQLYLNLGYDEKTAIQYAQIDYYNLDEDADHFELSRFDPVNHSGKTQIIFF